MRRFRPYFHYLRPLRSRLIAGLLCLAVYSAANGFGLPYLIPQVFGPLFDSAERHLTLTQVSTLALLIPALFLVRGLAGYASAYLFQSIGTRILEAIRLDYFRKLQVLPLSYLQKYPAGELTSRAISDAQQVQSAITALASDGIKHPLTLIGAIGYVTWSALHTEGVALALVCLAIVPLCVFPVRYVGQKVLRRAHQAQAQIGSISAQLTENLAAAREVRAFGLEARTIERFGLTTRALLTAQMKIVKYAQALNPAIEIISAFGIALTLVFAYRSGIKFSDLMALLVALYQCYDPIKKLGFLNAELKRGAAALERLEPVLREPVAIADPAIPASVNRLSGRIAFETVSFAYGPDAPALTEVSATIPAGAVCALVGPSGAGKSTFANLVPRFYDATAGRITIDGIDVRAMALADLRRNIALVSQDPVLFNDTIYANLLLGRPDATRAEVEQAARDAFAHDFILSQPNGYDTFVGERGGALSGGQRQRLALARAFLRQAPILILDEATSALDSESEACIQQAIKKLESGRTVLIIAHRFSTIRDASLILVFDGGRLAATGTHAELHAANPLYRGLYNQQQTQIFA